MQGFWPSTPWKPLGVWHEALRNCTMVNEEVRETNNVRGFPPVLAIKFIIQGYSFTPTIYDARGTQTRGSDVI